MTIPHTDALLTKPCQRCGATERNLATGRCNPCQREYRSKYKKRLRAKRNGSLKMPRRPADKSNIPPPPTQQFTRTERTCSLAQAERNAARIDAMIAAVNAGEVDPLVIPPGVPRV